MTSKAGRPKTGGRKKGTLNKWTSARRDEAYEVVKAQAAVHGHENFNLLGFMTDIMLKQGDPLVQFDMAKDLLPFVQPKLAALKLEVDPQSNMTPTEQAYQYLRERGGDLTYQDLQQFAPLLIEHDDSTH